MHSTQTQSARVKEKNIFYLLVTIVATLQEVRINVYFILLSKSSLYVLSYRSIYSSVNTVGYFSKVLIETLFTNKLKTVFCKTAHPKLSLHNSAAFCLRKKLRRDLPENLTFYSIIYTSIIKLYAVCFWIRDNQRYSKAIYISAQNKQWLYCGLCNILTVKKK